MSPKKKREHLRTMPYEVTPAQAIMRKDMEAGFSEPARLSAVLDDIVGTAFNADVTPIAIELIGNAPNLNLSFRDWTVVQGLVEEALRRGWRERDAAR